MSFCTRSINTNSIFVGIRNSYIGNAKDEYSMIKGY